jgi:O-antigen/teichoic acid export membrane protein
MSLVRKNIIANYAGSFWTAVMGLVFIPVYIRFMGIESFGLVGVYSSLMSLFTVLDMGLNATMNREMARLSALPDTAPRVRNLARTLEVVYWAMALVIALIVVLLAGPIADFWVNPETLSRPVVNQALIIMGFVIALRWPSALYSGGLMGMQRQALLNFVLASTATFRGVGAVLVLWLVSPTIQAFFLFQILAAACETSALALAFWLALPSAAGRSRFEVNQLRDVWRFSAGMAGISVAALLLTQTDKVILSRMLSLEQFGYYTLAWTVAASLYRLVGPLGSAVYPRLTQLVAINDQEKLRNAYHSASQAVSVALVPVSMILIFFGDTLLYVWSGDSQIVRNTGPVLQLLAVGTLLNGFMHMPYYAQLAHGWTSLGLSMNIASVLLLIPLLIALTSVYSTLGAAAVWVLLNAGYVFIGIQFMHRRILKGEKREWYLRDVAIPTLAALVVTFIGKMTMPGDLSRMLLALYVAIVGACSCLAAILAAPLTKANLLEVARMLVQRAVLRTSRATRTTD